ncbi:hypothetical protein [Brachybacterium kimchii]|nr:hypothetical protein [Brachybacterium kimchii]
MIGLYVLAGIGALCITSCLFVIGLIAVTEFRHHRHTRRQR